MGSRRTFFASLCVLGYCSALLFGDVSSAKALFYESSCGDELLTLDCGNLSIIAIHQAFFTRDMVDVANLTCDPPTLDPNLTAAVLPEDKDYATVRNTSVSCFEDLRIQINRRCSGMNQCNYSHILEEERICESSGGAVVVRYDCVRESKLDKYCNTRLHFKHGYISNPGYPSYYSKLKNCNWTIEAADGEIVAFELLHVHMRPARITYDDQPLPLGIMAALRPFTYTCDDDVLRILEGGSKQLSVCGEDLEALKIVDVAANKGAIVQFSSREFFPGSGFLLRYRVKGCPTLAAPVDGYLVYRNGSEALYMCYKGRLFNDTLEPQRVLECIGEHRWNDTSLWPCIDAEEAMMKQVALNHTLEQLKSAEPENMTNDEAPSMPVKELPQSFVEDILVPGILIIVLVVVNIIIVTIIFIVRRKQKRKPDELDDIVNNQKSQPLMQAATDV